MNLRKMYKYIAKSSFGDPKELFHFQSAYRFISAIYPTIRRRYVATEYHSAVSVPNGFRPDRLTVPQELRALPQHRKQPLPDWQGCDSLSLHGYTEWECPICLRTDVESWRRCVALLRSTFPNKRRPCPNWQTISLLFRGIAFPC